MTERGEYRAIRRVLLDGKDFHQLSERARWVFVALKLNFGPAGIEVHYPAALEAMLAAQTGATTTAVARSLKELEKRGWIRREGNVVWIIGHLENDPHTRSVDEKHRKHLHQHVAGLPRLTLVRDFVLSKPDYFPPSEASSKGLGWVFEDPPKPLGSSEDKDKDEDKTDTGVCELPIDVLWPLYPKRAGGNSKSDAARTINARITEKEDLAAMRAGTERYAHYAKASNIWGTRFVMRAERFYGPGKHYLEEWEIPEEPPDPIAAAAIAAREQQDRDAAWLDEQLQNQNGRH